MSNISKILTMASGGGGSGAFTLQYTTAANDTFRNTGGLSKSIDGNNMFVAFTVSTVANGYVGYVASFPIEDWGNPNWEKEISNNSGSTNRCGYAGCCQSSSSTLFAAGISNWRTDSTTTDHLWHAINSSTGASGDVQSETNYQASTQGYFSVLASPFNTDTVYMMGQYDGIIGSGDQVIVRVYTGSTQVTYQQQSAYGDSNNDEGGGLAITSGENLYLGISRLQTSPDISRYAGVIKVEQGPGNIMWSRELSSGNTINDLQYTYGVTNDANNDCVLIGRNNSEALLARLRNSDGATLGQLIIDDTDGTIIGKQVITDSSNNVYAIFNVSSYVKVAKFTDIGNGSSDLDWCVEIADTGSATLEAQIGSGVEIDETTGLLYLHVARTSAGGYAMVVGLPLDGSFTGNLGAVDINDAASTLTITVGTLTNSNRSMTRQTFSPSVTSGGETYGNATRYTETLTEG